MISKMLIYVNVTKILVIWKYFNWSSKSLYDQSPSVRQWTFSPPNKSKFVRYRSRVCKNGQ